MSTDTPSESITALLAYSQADEEGIIVTVSRQAIHEVVRENARLREDEKGLLQDIARLTEEAFKRDEKLAIQSNANVGLMEELAEAKREIEQRGELANRHAKAYADAQARALANEKDAAKWRETVVVLADACCHPIPPSIEQWGRITVKARELLNAAIAGAKHD